MSECQFFPIRGGELCYTHIRERIYCDLKAIKTALEKAEREIERLRSLAQGSGTNWAKVNEMRKRGNSGNSLPRYKPRFAFTEDESESEGGE